MVDIAVGGYIGDKMPEELVGLYELLSINSQQKAITGNRSSVYELGTLKDLGSQLVELSRQKRKYNRCS